MILTVELTETEMADILKLLEYQEWPAYNELAYRLNTALNSYLATVGKRRLYGGDIIDLPNK